MSRTRRPCPTGPRRSNPAVKSSSGPGKRPAPCFPLYEKQAQFLDSKEPVRGFVAGQGSGKSHVGAYDLLQRAIPGRTYMVTGPTFPVLTQSTVRTFLHQARFLNRLVSMRGGDNPSALIRCFRTSQLA